MTPLDQWAAGTAIHDDAGKPRIVYHGTDSEFDQFDLAHCENGPSKLGFWFTEDADFATMFGRNIKKAYLNLQNPRVISHDVWNNIRERHARDNHYFANWRAQMIEGGYDGLLVEGRDVELGRFTVRDNEVCAAFYPEQIRLVDQPNLEHSAQEPDAAELKEVSVQLFEELPLEDAMNTLFDHLQRAFTVEEVSHSAAEPGCGTVQAIHTASGERYRIWVDAQAPYNTEGTDIPDDLDGKNGTFYKMTGDKIGQAVIKSLASKQGGFYFSDPTKDDFIQVIQAKSDTPPSPQP